MSQTLRGVQRPIALPLEFGPLPHSHLGQASSSSVDAAATTTDSDPITATTIATATAFAIVNASALTIRCNFVEKSTPKHGSGCSPFRCYCCC